LQLKQASTQHTEVMGKMELRSNARAGVSWRFKITALSTEEDVERYLSNSFGPELYDEAAQASSDVVLLLTDSESRVLNRVLGIQYLDPWRAGTPFLLLRRLSSEETMSTRLTHDLGCNWTDEFPRRLL
jgi:hypothetical protein